MSVVSDVNAKLVSSLRLVYRYVRDVAICVSGLLKCGCGKVRGELRYSKQSMECTALRVRMRNRLD